MPALLPPVTAQAGSGCPAADGILTESPLLHRRRGLCYVRGYIGTGASVIPDEYGYYSKKTVRSVLKADKQMEKERRKGKLRLYDTVDEMFGDL